ncbi:MAG TPA: carboxylating nicotinate-nucleotide diphosphorylase [Chroococcales cyanobacterium]
MISLVKDNSYSPSQTLMDEAIELAMREDLGSLDPIDLTTAAIVQNDENAYGTLYCMEEAVVAGIDVFGYVLKKFDRRTTVTPLIPEGDNTTAVPQAIAKIKGPALAILSGERLALNLLQRMCGIATTTRKFVELAKPFEIEIRDTRKTTPGLRIFERMAVNAAGGTNHRFGLFDAILIKDNHIQVAGGVATAIERARTANPDRPIQVEVTSLDEVATALEHRANALLLDNMNPTMVRRSIAAAQGLAFIEVSGGVNLNNIKDYLIPGVNAISVGALTHSAPNIDISLEIEEYQ